MQKWYEYFLETDAYDWTDKKIPVPRFKLNSLLSLKKYLDLIHIRQCLIKPFLKTDDYPLVEARELLPSFESDLYEYENLPGFSLVALARPLEYFNEIFQFDILHSKWEKIITTGHHQPHQPLHFPEPSSQKSAGKLQGQAGRH